MEEKKVFELYDLYLNEYQLYKLLCFLIKICILEQFSKKQDIGYFYKLIIIHIIRSLTYYLKNYFNLFTIGEIIIIQVIWYILYIYNIYIKIKFKINYVLD
jgi:hypothetical protein